VDVRRLSRQAAALALVGVVVAGCSGSTSNPATNPTEPTATSPSGSSAPPAQHAWAIVALGDSLPHGSNCDCTPYPDLTGVDLSARPERTVTVTNDAVGGYTTADVLAKLQSNSSVIDQVRSSDVVEIEIGANDLPYSATCGRSVTCYEPTVLVVEKNLATIVARVHELTTGHQVLVVLLDYWTVWLGGQYAAAQGDTYVAAATEVPDQVNTVIKSTASMTNSAYVDLRAAFKDRTTPMTKPTTWPPTATTPTPPDMSRSQPKPWP